MTFLGAEFGGHNRQMKVFVVQVVAIYLQKKAEEGSHPRNKIDCYCTRRFHQDRNFTDAEKEQLELPYLTMGMKLCKATTDIQFHDSSLTHTANSRKYPPKLHGQARECHVT